MGEIERSWIKGPPPPTVVYVHCPPLGVVDDMKQFQTLTILRKTLLEMVSDDPIVRLNYFGLPCLGPLDYERLKAFEINPLNLLFVARHDCKSTEEAVALLRKNPRATEIVLKDLKGTRTWSEGEKAALKEGKEKWARLYAPPSDRWEIFGRKDYAYIVRNPGFHGNSIE